MAAPLIGLLQLVGDLGLGQAVLQRQAINQEEVSGLFWIGLAVNVAIAIGVAAVSPLLAWIYHEPRLIMVSMVLAAVIPISGLSTLPRRCSGATCVSARWRWSISFPRRSVSSADFPPPGPD